MSWVKISDTITDNPKIVEAGPLASWMYIAGICHANRQGTDGVIRKSMVPRLTEIGRPNAVAKKLVKAGLWVDAGDHFVIDSYLDYQRSRSEIDERKRRDRERKARARNADSSEIASRTVRDSSEIASRTLGEHSENTQETVRDSVHPLSDSQAVSNDLSVRNPSPRVRDKKRIEENREDKKEKIIKEKPGIHPDAKRLSDLLADLIVANGSAPPITDWWPAPMSRLLEQRKPAEVEAVIRWCQADEFWRAHIDSPVKLWEKFDKLRLQSQAKSSKGKQTLAQQQNEQMVSHTPEEKQVAEANLEARNRREIEKSKVPMIEGSRNRRLSKMSELVTVDAAAGTSTSANQSELLGSAAAPLRFTSVAPVVGVPSTTTTEATVEFEVNCTTI